MGEIAEMMLDGTLDYETGEYIGDPCGYPKTASNQKKTLSKVEKRKKGLKKVVKQHLPDSNFETVVNDYWENELQNKPNHINQVCSIISLHHFDGFVHWLVKSK